MKSHILSLIESDIRFRRMTEQLRRIGLHTELIGTNNVHPILAFMGIAESDKVITRYYKAIEKGIDKPKEEDQALSEKIYAQLLRKRS